MKFMKAIPLTIISNIIKYVGIKLTKKFKIYTIKTKNIVERNSSISK